MGLTDFQKKKVISVYQNLYDSNKDGVIDAADFNDAIEKISKLHHWGTCDKKYADAKKTLDEIWEGLKAVADKNKDGIVVLDEWIKMWDATLESVVKGEAFPAWQQTYMEFMFYANDTSGDGFIDKGEYVTIQSLFGNSKEDSEKAFDRLSEGTNPAGMISKEDFQALWHQYFVSDNREERGNFLFGLPPQ